MENKSIKTIVAGIFGNALECYDFSIYAFLSPILAVIFFPNKDPLVSLLLTFSVFSLGFLVRPLGGILFGYVGDHFGRKKALIISIIAMSSSTFFLGFLPSYAAIGIWAPILLTLLRLMQGIAVSGEMTTAMSYLVEHAPSRFRGFIGSLALCSASAGTTISIDLSDSLMIPRLLEEARNIDILINNAGSIPGGDLEVVTEEIWRKAWDLKVFGYINMTRAFYHLMKEKKKKGVIINITGLSGIKLDANYIAGSSGNACLETFTRTAGAYSIDSGVRILAVSPGATQTERLETLLQFKAKNELGDTSKWQNYFSNLPLKRPATPKEIANLAVFLASNKASYISGVVYHVDGGHNARGSSFFIN